MDSLKTINGIELGRGIAALLVVFYHISRLFEQNTGYFPFGSFTEVGHSGVDFFFVLSGFIIYYIHAKDINEPHKIKPYLIKRAVRIFPLFWIMFATTLMLTPFISSAQFPSLFSAASQLLLLPTGGVGLVLGVSWTLQFEVVFYTIFALLIINRSIGASIAFIWLALIIYHHFISPLPFSIPVIFSSYNLLFFMGCFAGYFIMKTNAKFSVSSLIVGLIYLFSIWFFEFKDLISGHGVMARLHYGIAFSLIVIGVVGLENKYNIVVPNSLLALGKSSYSIYLCHLLFSGIYYKLFNVFGLLDFLPSFISALIIISVTVFSSVLFSKWIEIPCTVILRKKLLSSKPL